MIKQTTVANFQDLIEEAEKLGFDADEAEEILREDDIPDFKELVLNDLGAYSFSEDTVKILTSFFESNYIEEFTLVD